MEKNKRIGKIKELLPVFLKEKVGLQGTCQGDPGKDFPEVCLVIAVDKELVLVWLDDEGSLKIRPYKQQITCSLKDRVNSLFISQKIFDQRRRKRRK